MGNDESERAPASAHRTPWYLSECVIQQNHGSKFVNQSIAHISRKRNRVLEWSRNSRKQSDVATNQCGMSSVQQKLCMDKDLGRISSYRSSTPEAQISTPGAPSKILSTIALLLEYRDINLCRERPKIIITISLRYQRLQNLYHLLSFRRSPFHW